MHVRFLTHAYPRWDGDVAGAFIERLAVALEQHEGGPSVDVVAPADEGHGGLARQAGVTVRRVRYAPAPWETLAYRGTFAEVARTLRGGSAAVGMVGAFARAAGRRPVDCLHAHWWIPAGVAAWMRQSLRGPPFIVTLHGTDVAVLEGSAAARQVARRVLRAARAITTVSSYLAERVCALTGLAGDLITVQPMPLPLERYDHVSNGGDGIVIVGRLVQQKRVALLLEGIATLEERQRPRVAVIGDGPERSTLEELARSRGLAAFVTWRGAVAPRELPAAMGNADLLLFGGRAEGLGLVLAEALFLGIPVVATRDGGGVTDLMIDGAGKLAEPEPGALGQAVTSLMGDPGARNRAQAAGAQLRERFGAQHAARVFTTLYERCLQGGKR